MPQLGKWKSVLHPYVELIRGRVYVAMSEIYDFSLWNLSVFVTRNVERAPSA